MVPAALWPAQALQSLVELSGCSSALLPSLTLSSDGQGVAVLPLSPPLTCLGAAELHPTEDTCLDYVSMVDADPDSPEWALHWQFHSPGHS